MPGLESDVKLLRERLWDVLSRLDAMEKRITELEQQNKFPWPLNQINITAPPIGPGACLNELNERCNCWEPHKQDTGGCPIHGVVKL